MNILIIEDDALLRKGLSHYFLNKGHTVSAASNGAEAIDLIAKDLKVDLILCDILMPVTGGPTFILLLKKYFKDKLPTLLIISGVKDGENFMKKLDVGYDYFLPKPIDFSVLDDLVGQIRLKKNLV